MTQTGTIGNRATQVYRIRRGAGREPLSPWRAPTEPAACPFLLREAGRAVKDGQLVEDSSGTPMEFEMLLVSPDFERVALPVAKNLEAKASRVDAFRGTRTERN